MGLKTMSVMEAQALDMSALLMYAYDIGELINASSEVATYLYWKNIMEHDEEVQNKMKEFARKKELFEECQRFGHFHPDYHAAMEQVKIVEQQLDQIDCVKQYKQAWERVDDLLYEVSTTIAHAVSDSIKVPSNKLITTGGCASGGSCSGNCAC